MMAIEWIPILFIYSLTMKSGSGSKCSTITRCRCYDVGKKLFADCSDLNLNTAPHFQDNVIGINLAKNKFSKIPQALPKNLLYLDISNNNLVSLDNGSIARYRLLQNLSLSENKLQEVSIGTFASNIHLRNLDISFNRILTIEVMFNVSHDLKSSEIQTLNFEKLHCTYGVSQIMRMYHVASLQHTGLLELNLASNRINSFELGVLNLLPKSLRVLNIADNVLSFGFYIMEFASLSNVQILNVSFQNSFHQVGTNGDFFEHCNDSRILTCNCEGLRKNSNSWKKYDNLATPISFPENLDNYSKKANFTVYLPKNLRRLYYHDNLNKMFIPFLPVGLNNKLTHLFVSRNIFYEVIGPLTGMEHVRYIDFSENFCKSIAKSFLNPFTSLEFLNASNNALAQVFENDKNGELFMYQKRLSNLDLSFNRIAHLPKLVFQHNCNMSHLNLSYNALSDFVVKIDHMRNLTRLDLSYNQLSELGPEIRSSLNTFATRTIQVNLVGNNMKCSCENLDFLKWIRDSKHIDFVSVNDYTCSFGNETATSFNEIGQIVQILEKKCSSYTIIIVLMTTLIIVSMTTTVSRILYRYRWKLRYMYYVAKEKYKSESHLCEGRDRSSFRFDAFISYADEERLFVFNLVKYLEEECNLRLCIHHRDFIPGTGIADNITNAIHCSRHTVCFMTSHFLQSHWCMFELNMARMEAIYSRNGQNVLFLVALEKGTMKNLPLQLMDLVDSNSYLEYPGEESGIEIAAFRTKLGETLAAGSN